MCTTVADCKSLATFHCRLWASQRLSASGIILSELFAIRLVRFSWPESRCTTNWGFGSPLSVFLGKPTEQRVHTICFSLEGPTRKPQHASVFSTHSDTQAVPAFHCIRMLKGTFFDTLAFLKRTDTLLPLLKRGPKTISTR